MTDESVSFIGGPAWRAPCRWLLIQLLRVVVNRACQTSADDFVIT
jgi:hypothetical protein